MEEDIPTSAGYVTDQLSTHGGDGKEERADGSDPAEINTTNRARTGKRAIVVVRQERRKWSRSLFPLDAHQREEKPVFS